MEEQLKDLQELLSKAWVLSYNLQKASDGEMKVKFYDLNRDINGSICEIYDIRDELEKA